MRLTRDTKAVTLPCHFIMEHQHKAVNSNLTLHQVWLLTYSGTALCHFTCVSHTEICNSMFGNCYYRSSTEGKYSVIRMLSNCNLLCPCPHRVGHNALMVFVCLSVCLSHADPKSRMEGLRKLKIGRREAMTWVTRNSHFQIERSKVKVIRSEVKTPVSQQGPQLLAPPDD